MPSKDLKDLRMHNWPPQLANLMKVREWGPPEPIGRKRSNNLDSQEPKSDFNKKKS